MKSLLTTSVSLLTTSVAVLSATAIALTAAASQAASFTSGPVTANILGNSCPTAKCVTLQKAGYTVTNGGIVDPAQNKKNSYLTPGSNTQTTFDSADTSDEVESFNVVSLKNDPVGAKSVMTVSNLQGALSFLWGSVDTYNKVEFFNGNNLVSTITGTNIANALGITSFNNAGNYNFDAFVDFTGGFNSAKFSVFDSNLATNDTQIAFEVAAAVPESTGISTLLVMGAIAGGFALKNRLQAL